MLKKEKQQLNWRKTLRIPCLAFGTIASFLAYSLGNTKRKSIQLERYLALARDAMIVTDNTFKILEWNEGAERLYGWKAEEVLGRSGTELLKTEFPSVEKTAFLKSIQKDGYYRGDTIQSHKDGSRIPVEVSSIVMFDKAGSISGYLSYNRDIQDRIQVNESLEAARLYKRSVLDAISANICVLDETGKILIVNKGWKSFCDENTPKTFDHGYFIGSNYLQVCDLAVGPGSWHGKQIAQGIRDVMSGKRETFLMEYPCNSPTEDRWFQARVTRLPDLSGHIVVAQELITNRIKAEENLRKVSTLQTTMFESAPYAIIASSVDGSITHWNAAATKMTGYNSEEAIGKRAASILMDREEIIARAKELSEELGQNVDAASVFRIKANMGQDDTHNWTYIRKDGTRVPVRMGMK